MKDILIGYIPWAIATILIGYLFGHTLALIVNYREDSDYSPPKYVLVLIRVWEGIKNVLLFRR